MLSRLACSILLWSFIASIGSCISIPSCCPKGYVLVDTTGDNARLYRWRLFKCVLQPGDPFEIHGFHIVNNNTNNIPKCEDVVAVQMNGVVPLGNQSCLGILDGSYHALTCPVHPSELIAEVNVVKKCCPLGSAYNFREKRCNKLPGKSKAITNFGYLFEDPTIVHSGNLDCLSTSVVVDYRSSDFNVSFRDGRIIVGQTGFDTASFCLESLLSEKSSGGPVDPVAIEAGLILPNLLSDEFLIRVCHTAAVCDRIACVRRCCKFDERLVRRNGTTMCISDAKDLHIDFYDTEQIVAGIENFTTLSPKIFGVLQMQKCPKYPLQPEYSDNDIYYFHYKDGSLYLPAEKAFIKNNDYCVQNAGPEFENEVEAFLCFDSSDKGLVKFRIYSIGLMISSVFLGLTILVYLCVPKLLNIPGKNLICHSLSMMSAYIGLFLIQHSSLQFTICYPLVFGVLQMQKCPKYPLQPEYSDNDIYYFHYKDGSLYLPAEKAFIKNNDYCVQNAGPEFENEVEAFLCFDSSDKGLVKFRIYSIGLMISSVFLGLTISVYLCVPKLLNIPGKNLICHSLSMMSAYIGLFLIQHSSLQFTICYPLAFFIYFSFMATFAWLNVMCFDIWWTFGSSQGTRGLDNFRDSHRFLLYSVYAWGVPSIFTTITLCIDYFGLVSDFFDPNIGEGRCWFSQTSSPPHLLFFLTPVGVLVLTNFILFVLTLRYCNRVKREIFRMQSSCSEKKSLKKRFISDKARFMMNTKLFIVMGVSWLLEIISTVFYTPEYIAVWYVSDFFNVLQGVFVFFIFVFKRRVWSAVADRFGFGKKGFFHHGLTTTVTTPTTMVTSTHDLRKLRSSDGFPMTPIRVSNTKPEFKL